MTIEHINFKWDRLRHPQMLGSIHLDDDLYFVLNMPDGTTDEFSLLVQAPQIQLYTRAGNVIANPDKIGRFEEVGVVFGAVTYRHTTRLTHGTTHLVQPAAVTWFTDEKARPVRGSVWIGELNQNTEAFKDEVLSRLPQQRPIDSRLAIHGTPLTILVVDRPSPELTNLVTSLTHPGVNVITATTIKSAHTQISDVDAVIVADKLSFETGTFSKCVAPIFGYASMAERAFGYGETNTELNEIKEQLRKRYGHVLHPADDYYRRPLDTILDALGVPPTY